MWGLGGSCGSGVGLGSKRAGNATWGKETRVIHEVGAIGTVEWQKQGFLPL